MKTKSKLLLLFFLIILGLVAYFTVYKKFFAPPPPLPYKTEAPQKRTIKKQIFTSGFLEIKDSVKIGTQVSGTVKDIYVKENQFVKKGTVLADIDIFKEDTDVKIAQENLTKTIKEFNYQKNYYARQKELFLAGQLSKNTIERVEADYRKAKADRDGSAAALEKAKLELHYAHITAPDDGIVTAVGATKGMAAINDYLNVLFEIAHDITEMKAVLDIDESDIGSIKTGQRTRLIINAFPDQPIIAPINEVSFAPKNNSGQNKETSLFYKAYIEINNKDRTLRPGMMLNAKVTVDKIKNALSISGLAFQINPELLDQVGKVLKFDVKKLTSEQKRTFKNNHPNEKVRYVWVAQNHEFIQKIITIGLTDENFWQTTSGLTEQDAVIVDVQEPNEMEKMYKMWFKGSL